MFSTTPSFDQNLILTGYMGPGQLQIARRAADACKLRFVDFEARLEAHAGQPGDEVRALYGEARLKTLEDEIVTEIALYRGALILISGGTLLRGAFEPMHATGPIICAVASVDAILQRLHVAMGARFHDPRERDLALGMVRREWSIRRHADIIEVDTSALSDQAAIDAIVAAWRQAAAVIDWRGI